MKLHTLNATLLAAVIASGATGCPDEDDPAVRGDVDGGTLTGALDASWPGIVRADGSVVTEPVSKLDVLFVIDNSGSMATKQARLMREVSRMIAIFTSGDRLAGSTTGSTISLDDKTRRFTPVTSLHLGVVSSNAGGIDNPPSSQAGILSCSGNGDDGKLQQATTIAQNGLIAGKNEFEGYNEGDVVIPADPSCALPAQPTYQSFVTSDDPTTLTHDLLCVARLGVRGCTFEQPLESMWKALAPSQGVASSPLYTFLNGSLGQADRANAGFLRADAVLSVVILSDEDDCAITDEGKVLLVTGGAEGAEADMKYGPLNLRCGLNTDKQDLVQPIGRFVSGLRSLKPGHPERIVVTEIVGVPQAAIDSGLSNDAILALPEMTFHEDPQTPGFPIPSCVTPDGTERSFGASRYVQLAKALEPQAVIESICADSYAGAVDRMVNKVAPIIGK